MEKDVIINEEVVADTTADVAETKVFTEEEVQKMIQAEADKRVNQALTKKDADYKAQLEAEKERIAKEASMTEEEKFHKQLEEERKAFEAERTEFMKTKLKAFSMEKLSEHELPTGLSEFIGGQDEKEVEDKILSFKKIWDMTIEDEIDKRLSGKTPKIAGSVSNVSQMTKQEFNTLPYKERAKLLQIDPELLQKLK